MDFLGRNLVGQRSEMLYSNAERKKTCQLSILYTEKMFFRIEGEIKSFPDKQKLKQFITTRPALPEMLKGLLQVEMKNTNK